MTETPQEAGATGLSLRFRITFSTQRTLAYVSVLELGTVWERCLRRAHIPIRYSQGFNPRPRMQFAAPLPVGCGGEAELLDIWLEQAASADQVAAALSRERLPADLRVVSVTGVTESDPALSEEVVEAEYLLWLRDVEYDTVASSVAAFLASDTIPMVKRGSKHRGRPYNLRPLILELTLETAPLPWIGLRLRVSALSGATGRPDELLKALGLASVPRRCTRTALLLRESAIGQ